MLQMTWVRDQPAQVLDYRDTGEPSGTWTDLACPDHGLARGGDVDTATLNGSGSHMVPTDPRSLRARERWLEERAETQGAPRPGWHRREQHITKIIRCGYSSHPDALLGKSSRTHEMLRRTC